MNKCPLKLQQTEFPMADEEQLKRLKRGVEAWNEWRRNNPKVKINLVKADLSKANLNGAKMPDGTLFRR